MNTNQLPIGFFPKTGRCVECTQWQLQGTIDAIISEALYEGMPCPTRIEACAAAYSVPDGTPIAMALVNLGCTLSPEAADQVESWNKNKRQLNRRF